MLFQLRCAYGTLSVFSSKNCYILSKILRLLLLTILQHTLCLHQLELTEHNLVNIEANLKLEVEGWSNTAVHAPCSLPVVAV
jgi:hypothetical protein